MKYKKGTILAIDFDGVIVPEHFPHIDGFMKDAKETIKDLYKAGYILILWTARTNTYLDENGKPGMYLQKAIDFLADNGIYHCFETVNENISDKYDCRKVYCHWFIDDRNVGGFQGWKFIREEFLGE